MSKLKLREKRLKKLSKNKISKNEIKSLFRIYMAYCGKYAKDNNMPLDEVLDMVAAESCSTLKN